MKTLLAALAVTLLATTAHAQVVPAGTGVIAFKQKLKTSCGSVADLGTLTLVVNSNATWSTNAPGSGFSGTLVPVGTKGTLWALAFDGGSLTAYESYLEDAATNICSSPVSISDMQIDIVLKLGKDFSQASLALTTDATGTAAIFAGRGKHTLKGKGSFILAP